MSDIEVMTLREDIKQVKDLFLDNLHTTKENILKHIDVNTKVILNNNNNENNQPKMICIKSCTKGLDGLGELNPKTKEIGDIFDIDTQDKMQLETDTMILTVPQDIDLKHIVGQEAYIVEFISNYMGYLLPVIYEHYHSDSLVQEALDNQLHCKSIVTEL